MPKPAKDGSVSVSISMPASEEELLDLVCSIKLTSRSAYIREAFWEKLGRDYASIPLGRKTIEADVRKSIPSEE